MAAKSAKMFAKGLQNLQWTNEILGEIPTKDIHFFYYYFIIKRTINPIKMRNAQQSDETHSIKGHVEKKAIEIIIK